MNSVGLLIALPGGLYVSGVVTWAVRLVNELAVRGVPCGLIVHANRRDYGATTPRLHPNVKVFDLSPLGPVEDCAGDVERFGQAYAAAADSLGTDRVILSPNLHGDSYGAAAAALRRRNDLLRIVGWCHLDGSYDVRVLEHYAPMLHRSVAVSRAIASRLAHLAGVVEIPYGVPATARVESRGGPSIVHAGRLDETIKRVGAVMAMSDHLAATGFEHRMTFIGDGPAASLVQNRAWITQTPPLAPEDVGAAYASHDLFVLASKAEGLSLAMLEAMRSGCIPVVTRVRSGATQVITHGESGMLVEADDDTPREELAARLARAVRDVCERGPEGMRAMREAAMRAAAAYSVESHVDAVQAMLTQVADEPPKTWTGPCAFSGNGSVPAGGDAKLAAVLESLHGERVVIHGVGRHTQELAHVIAGYADRVMGFCDDDAQRQGSTMLGLPVWSPPGPPLATTVVVSSWIHEEEIVSRAARAYPGKRVIGIYRRS
jgi:glycosyltransferase involved in cell wall biosynthesis